jgi:imidazolonepropionase-like amidohydrolase
MVLSVAALAALPCTAWAQSMSLEAESATWALTNARIETVTRGTIERGTVVIRDGIIEAVGANVTPPADARVVDLTGKTLYPGFIDLMSSMGLPQPAAQGRGGGRGGAPFQAQPAEEEEEPRIVGLEPNRTVATELRLTTADVRGARDQGLTTILVAPTRGLFRGLSALVPLRDDTATRWIVKSPVALHVGYQTVPGQYPGSLLGVIAYQRQAFYDAQRHAQLMERYRNNPRGMSRVSYDADLDALVPVVKGELPAFINANEENEILRALALGKEFNMKATVVGAVEAFRVANAFKGAQPPVLSMDFPDPVQVTGWQYKFSTQRALDDSATRATAVRRLIEGNAASLHAAGIRFSLASGGTAPNTFIANVKKAIAAGLPRNVAIEALTIRPAEAAGAQQQLGSIEAGKIANLQVWQGEALADGARLESVFVDGQQYDVVPAPPGRGGRGGRGGNTPPPMR